MVLILLGVFIMVFSIYELSQKGLSKHNLQAITARGVVSTILIVVGILAIINSPTTTHLREAKLNSQYGIKESGFNNREIKYMVIKANGSTEIESINKNQITADSNLSDCNMIKTTTTSYKWWWVGFETQKFTFYKAEG